MYAIEARVGSSRTAAVHTSIVTRASCAGSYSRLRTFPCLVGHEVHWGHRLSSFGTSSGAAVLPFDMLAWHSSPLDMASATSWPPIAQASITWQRFRFKTAVSAPGAFCPTMPLLDAPSLAPDASPGRAMRSAVSNIALFARRASRSDKKNNIRKKGGSWLDLFVRVCKINLRLRCPPQD